MPRKAVSAELRFFSKLEEQGDCWIWTAPGTCGSGDHLYGYFWVGPGKSDFQVSHRWVYEFLIGEIPEGLVLDHYVCNNTLCNNPYHLEPVPQKVNVLRSSGPAAVNSRREECVNGHPFSGDNLVIDKLGKRRCRECMRAKNMRFKKKLKQRRREQKAAAQNGQASI